MSKTILGMAITVLLSAAGTAGAQDAAKTPAAASAPTGNATVSFFLEQFDGDGDGSVSAEQFVAFRKQRHADTDENKDGSVDVDEYTNEYLIRLDPPDRSRAKGASGADPRAAAST